MDNREPTVLKWYIFAKLKNGHLQQLSVNFILTIYASQLRTHAEYLGGVAICEFLLNGLDITYHIVCSDCM